MARDNELENKDGGLEEIVEEEEFKTVDFYEGNVDVKYIIERIDRKLIVGCEKEIKDIASVAGKILYHISDKKEENEEKSPQEKVFETFHDQLSKIKNKWSVGYKKELKKYKLNLEEHYKNYKTNVINGVIGEKINVSDGRAYFLEYTP